MHRHTILAGGRIEHWIRKRAFRVCHNIPNAPVIRDCPPRHMEYGVWSMEVKRLYVSWVCIQPGALLVRHEWMDGWKWLATWHRLTCVISYEVFASISYQSKTSYSLVLLIEMYCFASTCFGTCCDGLKGRSRSRQLTASCL